MRRHTDNLLGGLLGLHPSAGRNFCGFGRLMIRTTHIGNVPVHGTTLAIERVSIASSIRHGQVCCALKMLKK